MFPFWFEKLSPISIPTQNIILNKKTSVQGGHLGPNERVLTTHCAGLVIKGWGSVY